MSPRLIPDCICIHPILLSDLCGIAVLDNVSPLAVYSLCSVAGLMPGGCAPVAPKPLDLSPGRAGVPQRHLLDRGFGEPSHAPHVVHPGICN